MIAPPLKYRYQAGFNIVEVLVALVVLSVGMLGIAGLYVTTLRSSGSAMSRTQAVNLASDIGDRIRANRNAGLAYANATPANNNCIAGGIDCSPAAMAANDLFFWQQQIAAALPGNPTGTITVVDGTPRTYTINISWLEPGYDPADRLSYEMRMQL